MEQKNIEKKQLITKDMTVGEVVQKYPHLADVLTKHGLHCVGCHAATWETLEQGTMGHGMDEDVLTSMVNELNENAEKIPQKKTGASGIDGAESMTLTDKAVEKVKELAKAEGKQNAALRVQVLPGGCAGMSYDLAFDDNNPTDDDKIFTFGDLKVYVDRQSLEFINGVNIDFVDTLQGSGFKIENPSAKSGCGCGNSFS